MSALHVLCFCVLLSASHGYENDDDDALAMPTTEEQIVALRSQVRVAEMDAEPLRQRYVDMKQQQRAVDDGFIWQGKAAKAMEPAVREAEQQWRAAEYEVELLRKQMKPLYGVVSVQHLAEHRQRIHQSFTAAVDMAQNHMWWDMILGGGRADSFEEVLMRMAMSFCMGLTFGYVIGLVSFILTAPFVIYEYCSSILDVPGALGMWLVGIALFLAPAIALYYSCRVASDYRHKYRENMHTRTSIRYRQ